MSSTPAQAAEAFHLSEYPGKVQGSSGFGNFKLITHAGSVQCENTFGGQLSSAESTLALTLAYSEQGCRAFGYPEAALVTVKPEGCSLLLHPTEQVEINKFRAHTDLQCGTGKSIKITVSTCALEVKPQSGLTTVSISNDAKHEQVVIDPEVTGLNYTVTYDAFPCPLKGVGSYTDGELTSNGITLGAHRWENPEVKIPLWLE